jgi:hypothetical protein
MVTLPSLLNVVVIVWFAPLRVTASVIEPLLLNVVTFVAYVAPPEEALSVSVITVLLVKTTDM